MDNPIEFFNDDANLCKLEGVYCEDGYLDLKFEHGGLISFKFKCGVVGYATPYYDGIDGIPIEVTDDPRSDVEYFDTIEVDPSVWDCDDKGAALAKILHLWECEYCGTAHEAMTSDNCKCERNLV